LRSFSPIKTSWVSQDLFLSLKWSEKIFKRLLFLQNGNRSFNSEEYFFMMSESVRFLMDRYFIKLVIL
jgi:hypothetical protein